MCRLLGIVASEPTHFALVLAEAPRCLATLSREHPDGWGIAIHDTSAWSVQRGTERAGEDARFRDVAAHSEGHVLLAHIRQKTVGPTRIENTHPFEHDGWVFAHNGTIVSARQDLLRTRCAPNRLAEIAGDTDSELLFAYLLTRLDERGLLSLADEAAREEATRLLEGISTELRAAEIGAFNFLLSDGTTLFAHRTGRSLYLLERGPTDPVRTAREVGAGATIATRWTARRRAIFVASEKITDEPWRELAEGSLIRIDRAPEPRTNEPASPRAA
jgi:glutamine amidotransferase